MSRGQKVHLTKEEQKELDKLLDEINESCQEGWDYNIRSNFYDIMNITGEIEKELNGSTKET